jgi:predicted O-methyltransferase YrrM
MTKILFPSQKKYLQRFNKEEDSLILEMEKFASEKKIPILYPESAFFLEQIIMITCPKRVLEIGTAIAYSSIRMARCLRKKGMIHSIEKSGDNIKLAADFIKRSGYEDKIKIIAGDALNLLPTMNKKYDLIFIDADKEDYKRLFEYSVILLKKGGIIFVDNLLWHGYAGSKEVPKEYKTSTKIIREFNKFFTLQTNLKTSILPIGDGIGLGIKI